jgi:hypothetical protein
MQAERKNSSWLAGLLVVKGIAQSNIDEDVALNIVII